MASPVATPLPRRGFWVAWVAMMVAAGGEATLAWRDGNAPALVYLSAVGAVVIWAVCGLLAWRLRPASRIGPLMFAVGVAFAVNAPWSFQLPGDYPLISVITVGGKVGLWLQLALIAHLFLTFPSGRPERGLHRQLLVVAYVSAAVIPLALLLVQAPDWCSQLCGVSPLVIVRDPDIHRTLAEVARWWKLAAAIVLLPMLVRRLLTASPREKRGLALPLGTAIGAVSLAIVVFGVDALHPDQPGSIAAIGVLYLATLAVPVAFLIGLLRERLAYAAVSDLILTLDRTGPGDVQSALARVLSDPDLRVLFPVGDAGDFVDMDGRWVEPPTDGSRSLTPIGDAAQPVAVLSHDPFLVYEKGLLLAIGAAAKLALENARLQAEVRAQLAEVKASRSRVVRVADDERRKLERNLHDGAQQRLLGMGMTLQLLRSRLAAPEPNVRELLDEADGELIDALHELRDLAQGIHPAVLTDEGLPAALGMLARRCPLPVTIEGQLPDRLPTHIEAAGYYLVSEALQNTVKHAHASHVTIQVRQHDHELHLQVIDDGVGGAALDGGTGLRGLLDRVTAADGRLDVISPSGHGTRIRAWLPCD